MNDEAIEAVARAIRSELDQGRDTTVSQTILAERCARAAITAYEAAREPGVEKLRDALKPFAAMHDIFTFPGGNRPTEGIIAEWIDYRVGERALTVEMLRAAKDALAETVTAP